MPVSPGVRAIMGVFGPMLEAAVQFGRGPQVMWQTFQAAYERQGLPRPKATIQDMNQFVSSLGAITASMARLAAAPDAFALTSEHWAPPVGYTVSPAGEPVPSLLATFQVNIQTAEGLVPRWSSVAYNAVFPVTVGELRADAIASVQAQLDLAALEEGGESPTAGGQAVSLGQMYLTARGL